jgi:ATP-dependent Clp protease ATP-binding subunit ClpA
VVGATTIDEYRRHLEKDAAIERRFQPVLIPEPGVEETIQILEGELEVAQAAKRRLAELGRQPEFGARPLRRTLQTELDNRLATLLLDGTVEPGDTVRADIDDAGRLTAAIGRPAASRETQGTPDTRRVPAAERQAGLESPDTENGGAEQ